MPEKQESKSSLTEPSDSCKGYWQDTPNGRDFDCEYEFAGHITCESCIFGAFGGPKDPRVNPADEDYVLNGSCSCHIAPPCGWCMALTEVEADIMWNKGRDALEQYWKENNYERRAG